MLNKDQTTTIINFAKAHPIISAIYLFGSHAVGHARSKSDIDLGILFVKDVDGFTRINMETEISNLLKKDIDLIDIKKVGNSSIIRGKCPCIQTYWIPAFAGMTGTYPILSFPRRRESISYYP